MIKNEIFFEKKRFLGRIIIIKKVRSDLMNNYDLWKWVAGKRTDKNKYDTYSKKIGCMYYSCWGCILE